jgi:hypothetical protein
VKRQHLESAACEHVEKVFPRLLAFCQTSWPTLLRHIDFGPSRSISIRSQDADMLHQSFFEQACCRSSCLPCSSSSSSILGFFGEAWGSKPDHPCVHGLPMSVQFAVVEAVNVARYGTVMWQRAGARTRFLPLTLPLVLFHEHSPDRIDSTSAASVVRMLSISKSPQK